MRTLQAFYDPVAVRMQTSRRVIAARYLRTNATMDILSSLPFDLIAALVQKVATTDASSAPMLLGLRGLRLAKLLRLLRSTRIMSRLEDGACALTRRRIMHALTHPNNP